mgnify:CR=1 FL=1
MFNKHFKTFLPFGGITFQMQNAKLGYRDGDVTIHNYSQAHQPVTIFNAQLGCVVAWQHCRDVGLPRLTQRQGGLAPSHTVAGRACKSPVGC